MSVNTPIVNARVAYVNGLALAYGTAATFTMAAGAASNSNDINDIVLPALVTNTITSVGPNGVDIAAAVLSSFYAVYVIGDSSGYQPTASLISLSSTAPRLPFGYDMFRRVGYILTDGSANLLKFWQYGNGSSKKMYYDASIATPAITTTANTYQNLSLVASVPPMPCDVLLRIDFTTPDAADIAEFGPFGSTSTNGVLVFGYGVAAAQQGMLVCPCAMNGVLPEITYKTTDSDDALVVLVAGYVDNL